MKITSAEFIKSAFEKQHWIVDSLPEIAFLGRSNVGKSSLINSLLGRKGLARTSNTPGRTQSINYYRINEKFYFVDLPGYGYAKVSKSMRSSWGAMAEEYLSTSLNLALCVQLIDARHPPTKLDEQLSEWLAEREQPRIIVATKADKLSKTMLNKNLRQISDSHDEIRVYGFSSPSGTGRDSVWNEIAAAVSGWRNR